MTTPQPNDSHRRQPLRLWPGVVALVLQMLMWFVVPVVVPGSGGTTILAGMAITFGVLVWWLFFSRAAWSERVGAIALMVLAVIATRPLLHPSIRTGMMGMLFIVYAVPALSVALVVWAAISGRRSGILRRVSLVAAIVITCGVFILLRTEGVTGDAESDFKWRWTPTAEQRLLAQAREETTPVSTPAVASAPEKPTAPPDAVPSPPSTPEARTIEAPAAASDKSIPLPAASATARAEWPGFRGPARDGIVRGVRLEADWSRKPPKELWRRPVGPGWSSFAVHGDLIYTQEQRGDDEIVSSYQLSTGAPVWQHRDPVRFWESNGGAGPRATPTVHNGRVYSFGATGILNALDARTGAVVWSRNAASDTGTEVPDWGFAASPLVIDDMVVVAAGGRLAAYDVATGSQRWLGPEGGAGYASPHFATIGGVPQILLLRGSRTIAVAPRNGELLWEHTWTPGAGILQPALVNGDVLLTVGDGMGGAGVRRIAVAHQGSQWQVQERWTSRGLKPYFNDFVVHNGHAFGFDGSILACIDVADGNRKWKGGRYGHGQLLLLPEQDLLLVLSEEGELALVRATPDQFTELARFPAMNEKTWNHPALAGDVLLVRNGEEMVAFRLALANR